MATTRKKPRNPIDPKRAVIGGRLKRAREHRGISQVDIADAAGVTRAAVSLWEAGRAAADASKLELAAKRLFVDYEWLLTGSRKKAPDFSVKANAEDRRLVRRARADSSGDYRPLMDGSIPEMKDGVGAGAAYSDKIPPREWWVFPRGQLQRLGADPENLKAFPVLTDNFEPLIVRGSVVFVDITQKVPVAGAVFAISNGLSLILKLFQLDMKQPRLLGLSDGSNGNGRRRIDWVKRRDITVIGRVVGQFSRV